MYTIFVDRLKNKTLLPFFLEKIKSSGEEKKYSLQEVDLPNGDIQIFFKNQLIIILERKRFRDLKKNVDSSLISCEKMISLSEQTNQNNQPLIGIIFEGTKTKFTNELEDKIDNLLRWKIKNIQIFYTINPESSVKRIFSLIQNLPKSVI